MRMRSDDLFGEESGATLPSISAMGNNSANAIDLFCTFNISLFDQIWMIGKHNFNLIV